MDNLGAPGELSGSSCDGGAMSHGRKIEGFGWHEVKPEAFPHRE